VTRGVCLCDRRCCCVNIHLSCLCERNKISQIVIIVSRYGCIWISDMYTNNLHHYYCVCTKATLHILYRTIKKDYVDYAPLFMIVICNDWICSVGPCCKSDG
jgi:hypothetical protein